MHLTTKERLLLQDMLHHEQLCIAKYSNYTAQAQDPQLKQLFADYGNHEQQHYDTITQILQGQQPSLSGQGQQKQQSPQGRHMAANQTQAGMTNQQDSQLCADALTTEKFVSGAYDTVIFEMAQPQIRQALQHIQKEEQQHGEGIFNYMAQHGMYQTQ